VTTGQEIFLDHLVALLCIAAWLATGAAMALRRVRLGLGLLVTAVLVTLARAASVAILAGAGWWFVEEKVLRLLHRRTDRRLLGRMHRWHALLAKVIV
jgi:hypothetical protein